MKSLTYAHAIHSGFIPSFLQTKPANSPTSEVCMKSPFAKPSHLLAFVVVLLAHLLMAQKVRENSAGPGEKMVPTGDGHAVAAPAGPTGQAVVTGNGINYNGGPVLKNTVPIYIIWYGNWRPQAQTLRPPST